MQPSTIFCLFTEILKKNVGEDIKKHYWRVLYSDFEEASIEYYLSNLFSPKPLENFKCNSSSEEYLRNPKTSRGSHVDREIFTFLKFDIQLVTQSL